MTDPVKDSAKEEDQQSTDADDGINRRRDPRVSIPLLVQYRFGALDKPHIDYALNVSRSGLFISTDATHPTGTRVFVQLTTRDGAHFLQGEGRVVRAMNGGYAIELEGFDPEAHKILAELVKEAMTEEQGLNVGPATRRNARNK
jgi:hypothetical protein